MHRLSEQLAGLPRLMKPLVLAMEGNPELVSISLRTLEYWVDSLNPEFLEPAMAGIAERLLAALSSHLQMPPYRFGAKVRGSLHMPLWNKPTLEEHLWLSERWHPGGKCYEGSPKTGAEG